MRYRPRHNQGITTFQIILLVVFGLFILAGIFSFALYRGGSSNQTPPITIWGTFDQATMTSFINKVAGSNANIYYVQKNPATFNTDLVQAIATGKGPDVILGTQDQIFSNNSLLITIPYQYYPQRTFLNTFIPEADLYLSSQGTIAFPIGVDPLMMYWNRVLLSNAGIAAPPTTWNQLVAMVPKLTVTDKTYNVTQSTVGLGDYVNINNAKAILSLLILQAGNPIVGQDANGNLIAVIGAGNGASTAAAAALSFYTQFADPTSATYSWNSALQNSQNLFIANQLAFYFGFASEYNILAQKNPNLDFDVTTVPQRDKNQSGQSSGSIQSTTYGNLYGFAVVRSSPNAATAVTDILTLTSQSAAGVWNTLTGLPAARIDSLSANPANPIEPVFNLSALWAVGWIDPNTTATNNIFQTMVTSVTSGQADPEQAVNTAQSALTASLQ